MTIAPITTTIRDIPSEVALSVIQTVQKGKLGALITTLSAHKLAEVDQAVSFALSLNSFDGF